MAHRKVDLKVAREWFYFIDSKGLLYLEETQPKIFTSALKDKKFLNFFFRNMRKNTTNSYPSYPWFLLCWGEQNVSKIVNQYIKSQFAHFPIVFKQLQNNSTLIYAWDLEQQFTPQHIRVTGEGLMVHPLSHHKQIRYGLLSSDVSIKLSECLYFKEEDAYLKWKGVEHPLRYYEEQL